MRNSLAVAAFLFLLVACPAKDATTTDAPAGKTMQLALPAIDLSLALPDDAQGTWVLVDGRPDGSFGRTTKDGTHTTTLSRLSSASCDASLAGAKLGAQSQGKTMNALDRPTWLPSRYWPVGLEALDTDATGASTAVWMACLDTKGGPLGALTTVTAALGAQHAASAPDVKLALESAADAALTAAMNVVTPPPPPPPG